MNKDAALVTVAGAFVSPLGRDHDQVIGFGAGGWFIAPARQAVGAQDWRPVAAADLLDLIQAKGGDAMKDRDEQGAPGPFVMPTAASWAKGETRPAHICLAALRQIVRHDPDGVCGGIAAIALLGAGEAVGPLS